MGEPAETQPAETQPAEIVVRGRRVQLPEGERPASVVVREGRIADVTSYDDPPGADQVLELADDEVLLPGVVDSHVHVNDPGRTDWEGFATATRAAAAGGVTTLVDMPLNSIPPTCEPEALQLKRETAAPQAFVDVGFWGGAVPDNAPSLRRLHDAGVFGFKCFLLPSGVDEFPPLDTAQLALAMREIAAFDGLLIVHAEDAHVIEQAPPFRGRHYRDFLTSRPREAEHEAIARLVTLARETGCRVHVLHVASAGALPLIRAARAEGLPITAETCPHYLTFSAEEIPDGATQFKCCPPIREAANREELWEGLREGTIDIVVSDHSPSTPDLKLLETGEFHDAWGGISSLQLGLSSVWTEARARGFDLADVVRWMCLGPALQTGLDRKGALERGKDADFVVFAPEEDRLVDREALLHRNPVTPYHQRVLTGVVRSTWLGGVRLHPEDPRAVPRGRLLTRGDA